MLTQHNASRLWVAGLVCLVTASASAQERTANYGAQDQTQQARIQPVIHWHGQTPVYYNNPWAGYAPGYNTYPTHTDPNRGYTAYGYTGGTNCWKDKFCQNQYDCAACRANFGRRFRCSMAWLRPLTYWDIGSQTDIIAVNPGYVHPNDVNQGYAAQGYGGPVSVPQAPNVRSNFNYGWGIPSSRLTPTALPNGSYGN